MNALRDHRELDSPWQRLARGLRHAEYFINAGRTGWRCIQSKVAQAHRIERLCKVQLSKNVWLIEGGRAAERSVVGSVGGVQ